MIQDRRELGNFLEPIKPIKEIHGNALNEMIEAQRAKVVGLEAQLAEAETRLTALENVRQRGIGSVDGEILIVKNSIPDADSCLEEVRERIRKLYQTKP